MYFKPVALSTSAAGREAGDVGAWAEVLGIPEEQIGRRDHFFDLGGTSLSGLKLAIALNRAVSFKDLAAHPILADQAALIDERIKRGVLAAPASVPGGRCAAP